MAIKKKINKFIATFLLFGIAFFAVKKSEAQNNLNGSYQDSLKNSFHLKSFVSIPVGVFRSVNFNTSTSGYALTGFGVDLSYGYKIKKGFCFKSNLIYFKNEIDNLKLAEQIKEITERQTGFTNMQSSAANACWKNFALSAGFSYQFWFGTNKKIGIETQINFGACYNKTPLIKYSVRIDDLTFERTTSSKGNFVFLHSEEIKFNYVLGNRIVLFFGLSYFGAKGKASDIEQIVIGNGTYSKTNANYKINLSTIISGLGITTRF